VSLSRATNNVTPVALIVLAAGTAAYTYFVDRSRASDLDRDARRTEVFPSFRADDVRRIALTHGSEQLVLAREDDGGPSWAMTSPRANATDGAAVDVLIRELEMATRVRKVDDRDAKGLDAPRVRGVVTVGPVEYRFVLGADAVAPAGSAYMSLDGEGTFVVGRSLTVQLLRGADAYRDRTLVPYGMAETARIAVRPPAGAGFTLERKGTEFRVGDAHGLRASRAEVDRLFGALADARAESFLDDAAADAALGDAPLVVVVDARDAAQPPVRFLVGGTCPTADAGLEGDVVVERTTPTRACGCVTKGLVEALGATADSFVDASPFVAHADEMEELRIDPVGVAGPRVELARRGTGWHERAPEERDLDADETDAANALAASLAGAQAMDVRAGVAGERLVVRARASIVRTGGASSEVVEVGPAGADGVALARRVEDGAVLRLPRAAARRFEPHPVALEGGPVWRPPVDPGAVVAVDDSCGRAPERLDLESGEWKVHGVAADNHSAADLVESFARARAAEWVDETDDGAFGFGRAGSCAVTLTLEASDEAGAPRRVGVVFGDEGEGGVYARLSDRPGVFVAPTALREVAARSLRAPRSP
jgi:Domain of unknown function (DUF4340)